MRTFPCSRGTPVGATHRRGALACTCMPSWSSCVLIFTPRGRAVGGLTCSCSRHSIAAEGIPLVLSNPKVQGRSCGALHVRAFSAVTRPSFLDYLRSGAEIGFMVAVVSLKGGVQTGGICVRGGR